MTKLIIFNSMNFCLFQLFNICNILCFVCLCCFNSVWVCYNINCFCQLFGEIVVAGLVFYLCNYFFTNPVGFNFNSILIGFDGFIMKWYFNSLIFLFVLVMFYRLIGFPIGLAKVLCWVGFYLHNYFFTNPVGVLNLN